MAATLLTEDCSQAYHQPGIFSRVIFQHAGSFKQIANASDPSPVSGAISRIASPQAYKRANPTATFFTDSQTLQTTSTLNHILYYVVSGAFNVTPKSGTQLVGVELAVNAEGHNQLLALGIPTSAYWVQKTQEESGETTHGTSRSMEQSTSGSSSSASPASSWQASHYMDTNWYDFVGLHLIEVKDTLDWDYGNGAICCYLHPIYQWWFSNDGWQETYENWGDNYFSNQTGVYAWTQANFSNNVFCSGITGTPNNTTYVYYDVNSISGFGDGTWSTAVDTWDAGGCYSFLHYSFVDG